MITITTQPTNAIPTIEHRVIVAGAAGDTQRARVKSAPEASSFYREDGAEIPVPTTKTFAGSVGKEVIVFTPDVSGLWVLIIEDLNSHAARSASYDQSPNANFAEAIISRTQIDVYVASKMTGVIGAGNDKATLIFYMLDENCIATNKADYGDKIGDTPRFEKPTSLKAENAMLNTSVSQIVGDGYQEMVTDYGVLINNWSDQMATHMGSVAAGAHVVIDFRNRREVRLAEGSAYQKPGLYDGLNLLRTGYVNHAKNLYSSPLDGYIPAEEAVMNANWHNENDLKNIPIVGGAHDELSALMLAADLYRCYNKHYTEINGRPASHTDGTPVGAPSVPGSLVLLVADFLANLVPSYQTPSPTANYGAVYVHSSAGFTSDFSSKTTKI